MFSSCMPTPALLSCLHYSSRFGYIWLYFFSTKYAVCSCMVQLVSAVFLRSTIWGLFFKDVVSLTDLTEPLGWPPPSTRREAVAGGASPWCVSSWRLPSHGWQCPWSTFYLYIFAEDCRCQSKQVRTNVEYLVWSEEIFKFIQRKKTPLPPLLDTPIPRLRQSQRSLPLTLFNGLLN